MHLKPCSTECVLESTYLDTVNSSNSVSFLFYFICSLYFLHKHFWKSAVQLSSPSSSIFLGATDMLTSSDLRTFCGFTRPVPVAQLAYQQTRKEIGEEDPRFRPKHRKFFYFVAKSSCVRYYSNSNGHDVILFQMMS